MKRKINRKQSASNKEANQSTAKQQIQQQTDTDSQQSSSQSEEQKFYQYQQQQHIAAQSPQKDYTQRSTRKQSFKNSSQKQISDDEDDYMDQQANSDEIQQNIDEINYEDHRRKLQDKYSYQDQYVLFMQQQKDLSYEYKWQQRVEKQKKKVQSNSSDDSQLQMDSSESSEVSEYRPKKVVRKMSGQGKTNTIRDNRRNFDRFSKDFYPQKSRTQRQVVQQFEPQFIKTQRNSQRQVQSRRFQNKQRDDSDEDSEENINDEEWEQGRKPFNGTTHGFMTLKVKKLSHTCKIYSMILISVDQWAKKYDQRGKKYWQNKETKHVQFVKPDSETYLIQACILGNIAFLQVYLKAKGTLEIIDQQKRNALHHSVSNGHKEITALLCNFGKKYKLIEHADVSGSTPLFLAIRYNEIDCLKILISYDCNLFHRKKNGDTCLHIAAAYNSLNSIVTVANYGGFELLLERNRQGLRPIDVAEKMRNKECYQALQKIERNLQYQNAILEREISSIDKQQRKRYKKNSVVPIDQIKSKSSRSIKSRGDQGGYLRNQRLKVIKEISSEEQYSDKKVQTDSEADIDYLGGQTKYTKRVQKLSSNSQALMHQESYMKKLKREKKKSVRSKAESEDIPMFTKYDKYKQQPLRKNNHLEESNSQIDDSQVQDQSLIQKSDRFQNNSRRSNKSDREQKRSYRRDQDSQELDKTKNFFHLSVRDDSTIVNPKMRKLQTARDLFLMGKRGQSQESSSPNDDEEMQYAQGNKRSKSVRSSSKQKENEPQSVFEKAISKTSTIVKSIGSFFKGGIEKIKDYVFQEDLRNKAIVDRIRAKSARSQSKTRDQNLSDSSQYETPRGKSNSRQRSQSHRQREKDLIRVEIAENIKPQKKYNKNQIVPIQIEQQEEESSEGQYVEVKTQRGKKLKSNSVVPFDDNILYKTHQKSNLSKGKLSQKQFKEISQQQQEESISSESSHRESSPVKINKSKSISIQAEPKKELKIQQKAEQKSLNHQVQHQPTSTMSLKSVGVGSNNINESTNTVSIYSGQSNKLQHSRMIQKEQKKRLGNKSKLLLKKTYQSSEDERRNTNLIDRSPSPAPKFMKEEIAFYKQQQLFQQSASLIQNAFEQKQVEVISTQQQNTQNSTSIQSDQIIKQNNQPQVFQRQAKQKVGQHQAAPLPQQQQQVRNNSGVSQSQQRAPVLLTQEQFDMIMLNSEGETKTQTVHESQKQHPQNNLYKVIESDVDKKPEIKTQIIPQKSDNQKVLIINQQSQQDKRKIEDMKKFYDDLIKNVSMTQMEENKVENGSMTINDTNLSDMYKRVMNQQEQQSQPLRQSGDSNSDKDKKKVISEVIQEEENIPFNPDDQPFIDETDFLIDYNEFDNQASQNLLESMLKEFNQYEYVSDKSYDDKAQPLVNSNLVYSNALDKGQFMANSYLSLQGGQNGKTNTSTLQRPLMVGIGNNSINNFNVQYQSDAECEYSNQKRGNLGKLNIQDQPVLKKKLNLIPPQNQIKQNQPAQQITVQAINQQKTDISDNSFNNLPVQIQNKQEISQLTGINNSKDQKLMIQLFNEDEEQERLNKELSQKHSKLLENQQSLAEELKNTFNDFEDNMYLNPPQTYHPGHQKKKSDMDYVNIIDNSYGDQSYSEDSGMKKDFQERVKQELLNLKSKNDTSPKIYSKPKVENDFDYKLRSQEESKAYSNSNNNNNINHSKPSRKNNRYEQEDSMINFDLTHSKLDQTDQIINQNQDRQAQNREIQEQPKYDSRQSLKTQIKKQIQSYVEQTQQNEENQRVEIEVLPLQVLMPAYNRNQMQSWSQESHSLADHDKVKKTLLGNMMVQAFSSSELKLVKRNYLPYNGATSTTQLAQQDTIATANANKVLRSDNANKISQNQQTLPQIQMIRQSQQSLRKSQNFGTNSQDSIVQELDSISKIYEDLETVQEEEAGHTYEKTKSLEETKIDNFLKKSVKKIPKQQSNRYGAGSTSDDKISDMNPNEQQQIETQPAMQQIFYQKEGLKYLTNAQGSNTSQNQGGGETDEQASSLAPGYWQWKREEKQNRSTANAFLYNLQTSSEDESKRKGNNLLANVRPRIKMQKNLLHSSVNAPLYQHGQSTSTYQAAAAAKRSIKDVSFKSNNVSTHTEGSERLKENLKMFQKNRMLGNKVKAVAKEQQQKQIQEQTLEESIKLQKSKTSFFKK
ncbi:ankyrin repeat domain-containing protein 6 [Stylonychia lemnae]|uniref:Ankyrin repeat domain-containing protein 6 n=1 Tax=Stylonychia lemnae TaxID=5949 RepID=A0A078B6M4_STYLE|nr:ankyrin repeat domain-containing protein 6 [Stylonychia lemnae]|eukprot:CDW88932.1 ankyrin repeat domain-containing protein 6 [Stylonychia lemnae]